MITWRTVYALCTHRKVLEPTQHSISKHVIFARDVKEHAKRDMVFYLKKKEK